MSGQGKLSRTHCCFYSVHTGKQAESAMKVEAQSIKVNPFTGDDEKTMMMVLNLCKKGRWDALLYFLGTNPAIALTRIVMNNRITTTILHQAIYAKGHQDLRAQLIRAVLKMTPKAASIPNGFGSLPIHVISQRNTNFNASLKEALIKELMYAHPEALTKAGGKGKRTPLHILFTDYISLELAKEMIQKGKLACFMKDKKGFLPIHVACSRHCSPDKLELLLQVNPPSLDAKTCDGSTPLSLAESTATKSHPNYTLILQLKKDLARSGKAQTTQQKPKWHPTTAPVPVPVSPDATRSVTSCATPRTPPVVPSQADTAIANMVLSLSQAPQDPVIAEPHAGKAAGLLLHFSHGTVHGV